MKNFFKEYHELLYKCNKPYQYVGGEFLSVNKDFDSAKVSICFAFPDKYEIGISNLGQRVLYGVVNDCPDYMADRVYAPDIDFKKALVESGKEFYSLEAKRSLKDFDLIGFSLQYELAYPTTLAMLEMAHIPHKNSDRTAEDMPIILAGGPCTYNPLPMVDFIDGFIIGDGEDIMVEICDSIKISKEKGYSRLKKLEELSKIEGLFIPSIHQNSDGTYKSVRKRIVQIDYENARKSYPIPFSTSVHDRATVEIRRGCGRMCRFCQPGHVTLPVRERSAEDIIIISKELVKNTGYNEYSLLSLSSNDYANIKEVIKELAVDFDKKRISVSLPSQRIDGFNLELANLVQEVRKSTMTLAPEAGSQRLRDTIRKNITEEQIIDAVKTLYENGWEKIKFYFIIGLPTETYEDIDEMVALFEKIKYVTRGLKREKNLKHGLNLTCTLSIFVPKPFTPFQWFGQVNLNEVAQRIHYLKENTKHIKGLKINYHERYVSQIEAVLTRGDKSLCKYIEALWKKGCYLDTWDENFDKYVWLDTSKELEISLEQNAEREFSLDENLPWNFIDTGLDNEWLKEEYRASLRSETHQACQNGCVNCGVCKNLKTHKVMASEYVSEIAKNVVKDEIKTEIDTTKYVKYRVKLTKKGILRYFSHLDWQNTFLKAIARSGLKVAFSQGFNPSMKVSLGIALPLFMESECELADIELIEEINIEELKLKLEKILPDGCEIISIVKLEKSAEAIDHIAQWAEYKISDFEKNVQKFEFLKYNASRVLASDEILMPKKNKKGLTTDINIKSAIKSFRFEDDSLFIILKTGQGSDIPSVRADNLMKLISAEEVFDIKRLKFYDKDFNEI